MTPRISLIKKTHAAKAIATIVSAFSEDPVIRWLYPDDNMYRKEFPAFVKAFGGKAFEHNTAFSIDNHSGVALWLPPQVQPDEKALLKIIQKSLPSQKQKDLFFIMEQTNQYHPQEPHWYLPLLGVDRTKHHNGYGSALLAHTLDIINGENQIAYLESSNVKNIPLYERYGFEVQGVITGKNSPTLWPMIRKPKY
jgi:ribosomal protein S18 acetylase RimI-like enzyme